MFEICSSIPLGAKAPSLKIGLCSFLFRVSLFPNSANVHVFVRMTREIEISSHGLYRSDSLFLTSSKCSRKRSQSLLMVKFCVKCGTKVLQSVSTPIKW